MGSESMLEGYLIAVKINNYSKGNESNKVSVIPMIVSDENLKTRRK